MFKWVATFNNFLVVFAGLVFVSWAEVASAQYSYSSLSAEAQEFLQTPSFTEFSRLNSEDQLRLLERTLTRDSQIVTSNGFATLSHLLSFVPRHLKEQAYGNAFSFAVLDLNEALAEALFQHGT